MKTSRDDLKQGATRTGNQVKQTAEQVDSRTQAGSRTTGVNTPQESDGAATMSTENSGETSATTPEVVEGKEDPNNEVVYKFNGQLYYVDRETKAMIKADESKLKDSKHKVMVHEGSDVKPKKSTNTKKSKS